MKECCVNAKGRRYLAWGEPLCEKCYLETVLICEDCGLVYPVEDTYTVRGVKGEDKNICQWCYESNLIACSECGELAHRIETRDDICKKCYCELRNSELDDEVGRYKKVKDSLSDYPIYLDPALTGNSKFEVLANVATYLDMDSVDSRGRYEGISLVREYRPNIGNVYAIVDTEITLLDYNDNILHYDSKPAKVTLKDIDDVVNYPYRLLPKATTELTAQLENILRVKELNK